MASSLPFRLRVSHTGPRSNDLSFHQARRPKSSCAGKPHHASVRQDCKSPGDGFPPSRTGLMVAAMSAIM